MCRQVEWPAIWGLQAPEGIKKYSRPKVASSFNIDVDDEDLRAEHERMLDEMDASIAEEVTTLPLM